MRRTWSHIVLRGFLALVLMAQSLLPASIVLAADAGYNVSNFICSPSEAAPSPQAQAHIAVLLSRIGQEQPQEPDPQAGDHCDNCVLVLTVLPARPIRQCTSINFSAYNIVYVEGLHALAFSVRGPPLGGRAPPQSL